MTIEKALDQFLFFLYTGYLMTSEVSGDPFRSFLLKNKEKMVHPLAIHLKLSGRATEKIKNKMTARREDSWSDVKF